MEMKVGKHIQSSFSKYQNNADPIIANAKAKSTNSSMKVDTFTKSSPDPMEIVRQTAGLRKGIADGTAMRLEMQHIGADNYEGWTKFNFEWIKMSEDGLNKKIPEMLEDASIPKDVTFEFDFDFDSNNIKITEISDEKYREKIEEILNSCKGPFTIISCASRVMNGYISSIYYPWISKALDRCFGQDINDLYIDENGNLGGVNENLQAALDAVKKYGDRLDVNKEFGFPASDIEGIVKRMVAEKNVTPNISHMGYDGESVYTNDGEFKFGKDFDPNLFGEEKYIMRGSMAFYMTIYGHYNSWLKNEEKF